MESVRTEITNKTFICQVEQAVKKEAAGSVKSVMSRLEIKDEEKVGTFIFEKGNSSTLKEISKSLGYVLLVSITASTF